MELLRRHVVEVAFHLEDHVDAVARLLRKYASVPMSLADGCLVRMAELFAESSVLTLDHDFRLYRKSGRHVVPRLCRKSVEVAKNQEVKMREQPLPHALAGYRPRRIDDDHRLVYKTDGGEVFIAQARYQY